jgi:hypothetical protein
MKIKKEKKQMKAYITLVVVILLVPFLLLQGINLVNISIDIINVSSSSIISNKRNINEHTCWEEILYHIRHNQEFLGHKLITTSEINCDFNIEAIATNEYKVSLESIKEDSYSFASRYIFYNGDKLRYIPSKE